APAARGCDVWSDARHEAANQTGRDSIKVDGGGTRGRRGSARLRHAPHPARGGRGRLSALDPARGGRRASGEQSQSQARGRAARLARKAASVGRQVSHDSASTRAGGGGGAVNAAFKKRRSRI